MKPILAPVLVLLAGCASSPPPPPDPVVTDRPAAMVPAASVPPPTSASAHASVAPPVAAAPPITAPATLLDPAKIQGYVMSRNASSALPNRLEARVNSVDVKDVNEYLVEWWISLQDHAGRVHGVGVYAPKTVPPSVAAGDQVRIVVEHTGGGPNHRLSLLFESVSDGSVLLAVNKAPDGWKIARGKAGGTTAANGYNETSYGVEFEVADQRARVHSGWARMQLGDQKFYVWGSAAARQLTRKVPMPDYVGEWLDSGILRAR